MKSRVLWQSCVVVVLGSLASAGSLAQVTVDCSTVAEDMARLKCYDEQAARKKAPAPAPARATPAPSEFGLSAEAIRKKEAAANPDAPKAPEQLVSRVKAVTTKARGAYQITLEDGQVWEETQHSSAATPPKVGETVTIKQGMLGSYFLTSSAALALRVKRIH
jgi:hypothetical protein